MEFVFTPNCFCHTFLVPFESTGVLEDIALYNRVSVALGGFLFSGSIFFRGKTTAGSENDSFDYELLRVTS